MSDIAQGGRISRRSIVTALAALPVLPTLLGSGAATAQIAAADPLPVLEQR